MPSAKPSAPASGAPASQRANEDPISSGTIQPSGSLTDFLREQLDHDGDAPARPAKTTTKPAAPASAGDDEDDTASPASPADADDQAATPDDARAQREGESEAEHEARLADLDAAEAQDQADARAQLEDESDADYEARLAELDAADATAAEAKDKVSPALQKRFGELTGRIKAQEAEIARLKAATPAPAARPASSMEEAVQSAATEEELTAAQTRFEDWEEFALSHPDGYEQPGKDGAEPVVYTPEQMRTLLIQARRALRGIPKQAAFIAQSKAADTEAHKAFPAYNDPDSPLAKAYADIVQRAPGLARSVPDLKLFVADALRGRALRTKGASAPALPGRPVVRPAPQPPASRGAPMRSVRTVATQSQQRLVSRAKAEQTGSFDDLTAAIESKFGR